MIVAGGPVRDRGWIVGRSIDALRENGVEHLFYLANDCSDDTEAVLASKLVFIRGITTGNPGYWRGERREGWAGYRYEFAHLAEMRNQWRESVLDLYPEATHFWSCDSDILPKPDCLKLLLAADKPCIGAYVRNSPVSFNFTLGRDAEGARRDGRETEWSEKTEPFEVTLTGACMLIRRDVLENVKWGDHPRGEDHIFAQQCIDKGYGLWFHPLARGVHHMGQTPDEVRE